MIMDIDVSDYRRLNISVMIDGSHVGDFTCDDVDDNGILQVFIT